MITMGEKQLPDLFKLFPQILNVIKLSDNEFIGTEIIL